MADAACAAYATAGRVDLISKLGSLTHNLAAFLPPDESPLKLRHLNRDKEAFDEVMLAEPPVDYGSLKTADSLMAQAHSYFYRSVMQWLGGADESEFVQKADQLAAVLLSDLQLVTIELDSSENSQEIFETLNARGTPLTAADLVRNFVFQRLESEGADTRRAYREDWPFESAFWTREVSVGRHFVSRSSLFLNQWLTSRLGEEISPQSTFTRFKSFVEHRPELTVRELLPILKAQAQQYERWTEGASRTGGNLSAVEMAVYRMKASGTELLKPLLLWLHEPGRDIPETVVEETIAVAESWVVRRQLLRLAGSDLGRIVADLVGVLDRVPGEEVARTASAHLAGLKVTSTYWPGDAELRNSLLSEPAYRRFPRPRLRTYLEAIENSYREETGQPQVERAGFPIEHILPQKWRSHWPVEDDPVAEEERQAHVHMLGNLTLLTSRLNSKVSNGPWNAKRTALLEHNTIKLTGRLLAVTDGEDWDESGIEQRTAKMVETLLRVWPVPDGHEGKVIDPQTKAQDWVEIKHLIEGEFLAPGDVLVPGPSTYEHDRAVILEGGLLEVRGQKVATLSGAAKIVKGGRQTNGWRFWTVADGRTLSELRSEFMDGTQPWNGRDWYVSFGEYEGGRQWSDGARLGFISAGGDSWYSVSLRKLPEGARVWAHIPKAGYVGVGTVTGKPRRFDEMTVMVDGERKDLKDVFLEGHYRHEADEADDKAEWMVPVEWIATRSRESAFWRSGLYANQNSATRMRHAATLAELLSAFGVDE